MFSPFTWIIVLLVIGFFLKRKRLKKLFYGLAIGVFLIFSSPLLFNAYARWWQPEPVALPANAVYAMGIVPGGFGSVDAKGNGYFNTSSDRFLQALRLYKTGHISNILISGGNSKKNDQSFGEASWARKQLIQMGVPDSLIFIEDQSTGTVENVVNSKRILDSLGIRDSVVLITSAFHMPRARKIFERKGLKVVPFPCNYTEGRGPAKLGEIIPSPATLFGWKRYIKETAWWVIN